MGFPDLDEIKGFCEEAFELADEHGVDEGLDFLIGQKFYEFLGELRFAQNQAKFIYQEGEWSDPGIWSNKSLRFNYALTLNENNVNPLEKIRLLEKTRDQFANEIKGAFDPNDIQDYLTRYPRLGKKSEFLSHGGSTAVTPFSSQDMLLEAHEIFYVEDMIRLLL